MSISKENEEEQVMELADALQYYVDEGFPPEGFVVRYTFGEPSVNQESHPIWERLKLVAAGKDMNLQRRVLLFKEKSFTQYEMVWMGHHKLLVDTTNSVCELVETITKELDLQPTFTFGFLGSNPPPVEEVESEEADDDLF